MERIERTNGKERMVSEQGPDEELKFPVLAFSMLNTSSITHHYPTALALGAALSLSRPESLMPAELENRMGHEEGVGEKHTVQM